jgi:cellulose synthase (UDP-forming)
LMYALAPTMFLVFGINPIRGLGLETLAYALPHFFISTYANYITYKHVRFSFWNEIYEFAMSFHAGIVTLLALINPKLGSFNVTDKGMAVTKRKFDWNSSRGLVIAGVLVVASLFAVPLRLYLTPETAEAVLVNMVWSFFNLILIVSAILVAFEQPQLRRAHRLDRKLTAIIYGPENTLKGITDNVSESGCQLILDAWAEVWDEVDLELIGDYGARAFLRGQIIRAIPVNETQVLLSINFVKLTTAQLDALSVVIYSDVKEWYSQNRAEVDDPMQSFKFIASSVTRSLREPKPAPALKARKAINAYAQLYWRGHLYAASGTEIGPRGMRLTIAPDLIANLAALEHGNPLVGLLLSQDATDPLPKRLLAQIATVMMVNDGSGSRVAVELTFPEPMMARQESKIKQLVRGLH